MTGNLASWGGPFSRIQTLQFHFHVACILFSLIGVCAYLVIYALLFVRCSFMYTSFPFNFLTCFNRSILCFCFANFKTMAGFNLLVFLRSVWQAAMVSFWMFSYICGPSIRTMPGFKSGISAPESDMEFNDFLISSISSSKVPVWFFSVAFLILLSVCIHIKF